jgi:hypothetical protein
VCFTSIWVFQAIKNPEEVPAYAKSSSGPQKWLNVYILKLPGYRIFFFYKPLMDIPIWKGRISGKAEFVPPTPSFIKLLIWYEP